MARVELALPDRNERRQLVEEVARQWMRANPRQAVKIDAHALELLVENMSGLSAADTQRLARKAICEHGAIQLSDVPVVMRAKYEMLNRGGVLRYEPDTAQLSDVEGNVSLEPAGTSTWTGAAINRPLTLGDKVWADQDSRAEIDIGDAVIRLGSMTGFSFLNLDGQTAQMQVTAGTVIVHVNSLANGEQDEIEGRAPAR